MPVIDAAPASALRPRIATLLRSASVEITARARSVDDAVAARLARGTSVYVTALPGDRPDSVVATAVKLRRAGLNPVPHIGARYFASLHELEELLRRLTDEAGVTQLLVIGGTIDPVRGAFAASLELLRSGALEKFGIRRVGLGGYPEGHPQVPDAVLEDALAAKIERLQHSGISPYVVTQFCFTAEPIGAWVGRFSARYPDIDVHVGLAGPAGVATLLKYGLFCGIGPSLRALRRNSGLGKLLTEASPAPIIAALAGDEALGGRLSHLHFFTFGGIRRTAEWLHETAAQDQDLPR